MSKKTADVKQEDPALVKTEQFSPLKEEQHEEENEDEEEEEESSNHSEESEEEDQKNEYMIDDFVVGDDEPAEEASDQGSDLNKKSEKKHKKKRKRSEDMQLEEEDLELIAEAQEEENRHEKHRRLKKNLGEDEENEDVGAENEEDEDQSFIEDTRGRKHQKTGNYSGHANEIVRDFLYGPEDMEAQHEVEEKLAEKKKRTLQEIFGTEELDEKFAGEEDLRIKNTDIPERLQLRYKDRPAPNPNELQAESLWIFEKMKKLKSNPLTEAHRAKIYTALNNLRVNYLEVMFQAFYRKNELLNEINTNDLWVIYELDEEWGAFYAEKEEIKKDMALLENHVAISKSITELFFSTFEKFHLDFIQDFISYNLSKYASDVNQNKMENLDEPVKQVVSFKRPLRRHFAQEAIQVKLDQVAKIAGLSADQFFENLQSLESGSKIVHIPRYYNSTPEKVIDDYRNPSNILTVDTLSTMMNLCKFMANDIFYHPCIRNWARKQYIERVTVSTEPTAKGKRELDVTSPNFIVKRIARRPIGAFTDDLWLRIAMCEDDGLIKVKFLLPWEDGRKPKETNPSGYELKDEVYSKLLNAYLAPFGPENSEKEQEIMKQWNVLRAEVVRVYVYETLYPNLEKKLREELKERAERYVAKVCAEKFRNQLNVAPYLIEEGTSEDSEKKRKATMVAVVIDQASSGKVGVVYCDQNGELVDHLVLKFFAIAVNERNNPEIQESFRKDMEHFDKFILKFKPDVIAISANCLEAKRIKQMIADYKDTELKTKKDNGEDVVIPWITYGDNIVPQLFAKTKKADKEFKDFPILIKEAVSLARMIQNPMAEVLNLWSNKLDENPVFYIPAHPLQSFVNGSRLQKEYERVAIEMVNSVGVDINDVIAHRHGANQLQFLCGLGPRKAAYFLEFMSNPNMNMLNVGVLRFRSEVYISKLFEKNVYFNVAGFLKIRVDRGEELGKREALDSTRINPENYMLAKKIARDALDEDVSENMQDWVPKVMKDSVKLKDLDLEDYANHLATQKGKPNMIHVLRFIEKELTCPFEDPRTGKQELENKDLFYRLCKENPLIFRPHCFVTVRVFKINPRNLLCKISENGLIGIIDNSDIFEKKESLGDDLSKIFQVGQIIRAKIKAINFENAINGDDQKKRKSVGHDLRVELTIKPSDMRITGNELKELFPNWESIEKHFKIVPEEDFPHFTESQKGQIRYIPRKINHPKFKNISIAAAMNFLNDRSVGEFVLRPSSKGTEHLNITWKFYENVIVHIDVREGMKAPNALVGSKFYIGKDVFDSLDEIIEKYINRCNQYMKAIVSHSKFRKEELDGIEQELINDRQQDTKRIPYYFGCFESSPHYIVLCYLLNRNEIIKEYIKIKPSGLFFHNQLFQTLSSLIDWFKKNFRSSDYQRYLKKIKPPYSELLDPAATANKAFGLSKEEASDNNIWGSSSPGPNNREDWANRSEAARVKEEKIKDERVKRETAAKSTTVCNTCGKIGHSANECYSNKKSFRAPSFETSSRYSRGNSQERGFSNSGKKPRFNKPESQGWGTMGQQSDSWGAGSGPKAMGGGGRTVCYNCQQEGHFSRECPAKKSSMKCFSCGEEGHRSNECTKPKWGSKGRSRSRSRERDRVGKGIKFGGGQKREIENDNMEY